MVTETRMLGRDMQEEILKTVHKTQEIVLNSIRTWAEAVQPIAAKLPLKQLPLAGKLPKPEEMVENTYDFAEKLLAGQRKFAEDVLKAAAPVVPGKGDGHAAKPHTGTAKPHSGTAKAHTATGKPHTSK